MILFYFMRGKGLADERDAQTGWQSPLSRRSVVGLFEKYI